MNHGTPFGLPAACLIVAAMIASFATPTVAQPQNDFATKGSVEVGGSISFFNTTPVVDGTAGDAITTFQFAPFVGYFFADEFELGFNPFSFATQSQSGHSFSQVMILLAPSYNIRTGSNAYPFVEGLIGFSSQSDGSTASGVTWGFRGGVKVAVTGKGLLNLGLQYLQVNLNPSGAVNRYGSNEIAILAGFTVWF